MTRLIIKSLNSNSFDEREDENGALVTRREYRDTCDQPPPQPGASSSKSRSGGKDHLRGHQSPLAHVWWSVPTPLPLGTHATASRARTRACRTVFPSRLHLTRRLQVMRATRHERTAWRHCTGPHPDFEQKVCNPLGAPIALNSGACGARRDRRAFRLPNHPLLLNAPDVP